MINNIENRIRELLSSMLTEMDGYLVDLRIRQAKVDVFIDRDPHINIAECVRISRSLLKQLDEEFPFSDQYELEVSSPGMDEPFKVMRQYQKSIGKNVSVIVHSGENKTGILRSANEERITLEETIMKSKKEKEILQTVIPFNQIKTTTLVFNFKNL